MQQCILWRWTVMEMREGQTKPVLHMGLAIVMGNAHEMSSSSKARRTSKIGRSIPMTHFSTVALVPWDLAAQRWTCGRPTPWPQPSQLTPAQRRAFSFAMAIPNVERRTVIGTLPRQTETDVTSIRTGWATPISMVLEVHTQWIQQRSSLW